MRITTCNLTLRTTAYGLLLCASACGGSGGAAGHGGANNQGQAGSAQFGNAPPLTDGGGPTLLRDGSVRTIGDAATCATSHFGATEVQANMLLVIDKSGSMMETPQGFGSDKWSAMKDSLGASLAAVKDKLYLGLELFPHSHCEMPSDGMLEVDVQAGAMALPLVMNALMTSSPSGGTPTAAALGRALDYFTKGKGKDMSGNKYVLLATDGGPNCNTSRSCDVAACTVNIDGQCPNGVANCCDPALAGSGAGSGCLDDQATLDQIKALASAGIDTFVVGIPGTESYTAALKAFADAGGRPNTGGATSYYAVSGAGTGVGGLTTVLSTITSSVIQSCTLALDSVPKSFDQLNVALDGTLVPQSGPDGWELDQSVSPPTIQLKGKTCDRVEQSGVKSVEVRFGCPTLVL